MTQRGARVPRATQLLVFQPRLSQRVSSPSSLPCTSVEAADTRQMIRRAMRAACRASAAGRPRWSAVRPPPREPLSYQAVTERISCSYSMVPPEPALVRSAFVLSSMKRQARYRPGIAVMPPPFPSQQAVALDLGLGIDHRVEIGTDARSPHLRPTGCSVSPRGTTRGGRHHRAAHGPEPSERFGRRSIRSSPKRGAPQPPSGRLTKPTLLPWA